MNNNLSPEQLLKMTELMRNKGMSESQQKKNLTEYAMKNMSGDQSEQLRKILSDADAVKELMNSKKAQELIQKLKNQK